MPIYARVLLSALCTLFLIYALICMFFERGMAAAGWCIAAAVFCVAIALCGRSE